MSPRTATSARSLLLSLQDDEALRTYADNLLGPISDGEEYGPELLRSLEAFIERNGQWERAPATSTATDACNSATGSAGSRS